MSDFENELTDLINAQSQENVSNTPDFVLAMYLQGCLNAFNQAVQLRENFYGRDPRPSTPGTKLPMPTPNPSAV